MSSDHEKFKFSADILNHFNIPNYNYSIYELVNKITPKLQNGTTPNSYVLKPNEKALFTTVNSIISFKQLCAKLSKFIVHKLPSTYVKYDFESNGVHVDQVTI